MSERFRNQGLIIKHHINSSVYYFLLIPQTRIQLRLQSFHSAVYIIWNSLPTQLHLRSINWELFRDRLKTHVCVGVCTIPQVTA